MFSFFWAAVYSPYGTESVRLHGIRTAVRTKFFQNFFFFAARVSRQRDNFWVFCENPYCTEFRTVRTAVRTGTEICRKKISDRNVYFSGIFVGFPGNLEIFCENGVLQIFVWSLKIFGFWRENLKIFEVLKFLGFGENLKILMGFAFYAWRPLISFASSHETGIWSYS